MTNLPFVGRFRVTCIYHKMNTPRLKWLAGFHTGIDLVGDTNKIIYSVCNGKVILAGWYGSYGKCVQIQDEKTKNIFLFAHLKEIYVRKGQKVTRTTRIGFMGASGRVYGEHLHLEMRTPQNRYGKVLDISRYLGIPNKVGTYNSEDFKIDENNYPHIRYDTHIQNIGWQGEKKDFELAGTTDKALRVEAIIINADIPIQYRVHVQDKGWTSYVPNGCVAGTIGESRRIEAIEIISSKDTLKGQAYCENLGWLDETKGTHIKIGTEGQALRLEAYKLDFI